MPSSDAARALMNVQRVEQLCEFIEHPAIRDAVARGVPVTMPPDIGALGFDGPFWVGLGIVGLWAALDAYDERTWSGPRRDKCPICARLCVFQRFENHLRGIEGLALKELDDLRHLYAHNYAGEVDSKYASKRRHVLIRGTPADLTVGARFDGECVPLNLSHLRTYAGVARDVLERL